MTDTRSPDELAEHLARALNRGLGRSWHYSNHGYYPNGYDDYPRGIQNMLYEGVEAVLAAINDERPDPRYCSWCGQRLAMPEPAPDALPCGHPRSAVRGDVTHWCAMCEKKTSDDRT